MRLPVACLAIICGIFSASSLAAGWVQLGSPDVLLDVSSIERMEPEVSAWVNFKSAPPAEMQLKIKFPPQAHLMQLVTVNCAAQKFQTGAGLLYDKTDRMIEKISPRKKQMPVKDGTLPRLIWHVLCNPAGPHY